MDMKLSGCPNCGDRQLVLMNTLSLKYCVCCNLFIHWPKDEGEEDYR